MYYYIQAMYQAWCDGQQYDEVRHRYKVFVSLASKHLSRAEPEIETYLKEQPWFRYQDTELL